MLEDQSVTQARPDEKVNDGWVLYRFLRRSRILLEIIELLTMENAIRGLAILTWVEEKQEPDPGFLW